MRINDARSPSNSRTQQLSNFSAGRTMGDARYRGYLLLGRGTDVKWRVTSGNGRRRNSEKETNNKYLSASGGTINQ